MFRFSSNSVRFIFKDYVAYVHLKVWKEKWSLDWSKDSNVGADNSHFGWHSGESLSSACILNLSGKQGVRTLLSLIGIPIK